MLSMSTYPMDHVERCRAWVGASLSAYDALASTARGGGGGAGVAAFEPRYLEAVLLALDGWFCHRSRTLEGKDGNPLNEVRVLASSLILQAGVMTVDKAIKLRPDASVLGIEAGERIALTPDGLARLADAFLASIEQTYCS
jgi:hypothetical protein